MSRFFNTLLGAPTTVVVKQGEEKPLKPGTIARPTTHKQAVRLENDKFRLTAPGTELQHCEVHITCENAVKLKEEIKRIINEITNLGKDTITKLKTDLENLKGKLMLENLSDNIKQLEFIDKSYNNIKSMTSDQMRKSYNSTKEKIPVKVFVASVIDNGRKVVSKDAVDGFITQINIGMKEVKVEYKYNDEDLSNGVIIDNLCIIETGFCGIKTE